MCSNFVILHQICPQTVQITQMEPLSHSPWNAIQELHRRLYLRIVNN